MLLRLFDDETPLQNPRQPTPAGPSKPTDSPTEAGEQTSMDVDE